MEKNTNELMDNFEGGSSLQEVWKSKPLTERDLNIPKNVNVNMTGVMVLGKGAYRINHKTYFREDVFSSLDWKVSQKNKGNYQQASALFHLKINGVYCGLKTLMIKFDARTYTKPYLQVGGTTFLRWGEFKPFICQPQLVGKILKMYVVNDRMTEFLIEIKDDTVLDV